MKSVLVALAVVIAYTSDLSKGVNYNGTWHNQLGSYMSVSVTPDGKLTGNYTTALINPPVEAPMIGFVGTNGTNSTFGFVAKWSTTYIVSWNGEYKTCNGADVLFTDFILKQLPTTCHSSTLSTRSGKDCFTRYRQIQDTAGECDAEKPADVPNPCNTPC